MTYIKVRCARRRFTFRFECLITRAGGVNVLLLTREFLTMSVERLAKNLTANAGVIKHHHHHHVFSVGAA